MKLSKKILVLFICLILLAIVLTVASLFTTSGIYLLATDPKAIDFLAFYTGGELLTQSPHVLYNLHEQQRVQQQIAPVTSSLSLFLPFLNPPFVALLFVPATFLGLQLSYAMWVGINIFLLILICLVGILAFSHVRWLYRILLVLGISSFIPLLTSVLLGQLSLLLCLIFLFCWLLLQKKKEFLSGLLLSLLLIKPHLVLIPIVYVILQRRRFLFVGLLTGIGLLTLLSFFLIGTTGMLDYLALLQSVVGWNAGYGIDIMAQHSLQTVLLILLQTTNLTDIRLIWAMLIGVLLIPSLLVWSKKRLASSLSFSLQFATTILMVLLTSPHTHFHDVSLLIVVAIILLSVSPKMEIPQRKKYLFLLLLGYFIMSVGYLFDLATQTQSRQLWIVSSVTYQIVLLFHLLGDLFYSRKDGV